MGQITITRTKLSLMPVTNHRATSRRQPAIMLSRHTVNIIPGNGKDNARDGGSLVVHIGQNIILL